MLVEIENAVEQALAGAGLSIADVDIDNQKRKQTRFFKPPAAYVSIDLGEFSKAALSKYKCSVTLFIMLVFKDTHSPKKRRHKLYPAMLGVFLLLFNKTLGLSIDPIKPARFSNITDTDMAEDNLCAYLLEFSTAFTIEAEDEESTTAQDLITLSLEYFLQDPEDDGEMDAQDLITLET